MLILENREILETKMKLAIAQAEKSVGEVPIGSVIVNLKTGDVIASSHNEREKLNSAIRHAEITAIEIACEKIGDWRLNDYCIFSTLEPCLMCAGALMQARIGAVVFGAFDELYGAAGSIYNFFVDPRLNHSAEVISGILKSECEDQINKFFATARNNTVLD